VREHTTGGRSTIGGPRGSRSGKDPGLTAAYTSAIMMDGRSARLTGPLSARAKRAMAVAGALAVAALAAVGVWAATHSDTYAHSGNGCVTVSLSSSTGGALLHDCGAGARALCRTAFAAHDKTALLTQAQCRIAGLGGLASPAGSPRP